MPSEWVTVTIICLEGPSAVGKTTTARALESEHHAYWVQEAPHLFTPPDPQPKDWYLERQVERYNIAQAALSTHPLAVLDGDPFQPLWYRWTYPPHEGWLEELRDFYRGQLMSGALRFPDAYLVLHASEADLRGRKEADVSRQRRNFERHLRLVETLPQYFRVLAELMPRRVQILEAQSVEQNVQAALGLVEAQPASMANDVRVFDDLMSWLERQV